MLGVILAILIVPLAVGHRVLPRARPAWRRASRSRRGSRASGSCSRWSPRPPHGALTYLSYLRADALSCVFLLATAFLYAAVAVYAAGYLKGRTDRYARRFYLGFNVFAWAMLAAPLMSSLALLWIAVEVTTVVSALLVAIEDTDGAAEAAWKYVLIASAGLGLGLLATIFAYYAGAQVLGAHSNLAIQPLIAAGSRLPKTPVELAFLLAVLGYGTKVGLVPVHTWLPDAHSEAPTPVSALLSGALLATSFYAILRFYQVAAAALGSGLPRDTLLAFGIASLLLASLYVFGQRDVKRLLAYSSVEHMGILAIGVSFGAPVALAGVLLHVLAHAAAKGNAFMGAGVFTVKYGTKQMSAMRDGLRLLPWSGPLFLLVRLRAVRLPAVRHLPQRVRDRRRRARQRRLRGRGGARGPGDDRLLRAGHLGDQRAPDIARGDAPAERRTPRPRRPAAPTGAGGGDGAQATSGAPHGGGRRRGGSPRRGRAGTLARASRAPGWSSRCWPGWRSWSCSGCTRRAS